MAASFSRWGRAPVPPWFRRPQAITRTGPVHGPVSYRPASTPPHDLARRRRAAAARLVDDRSSPPGLHPPRRRSGAVHRVHRHRREQLGARGDGGVRDSGRGGAGACPAHHPGHHRPGAIEGSPGMTARELFSEERSAEVVTASFEETPDPRLKQVLTSLVRHLHDFVKDVELTEEEWGFAVDFLTRTGHMSDDMRQEFILLSDVLGVSMLVETINHRTGGQSTESTVLGPFHVVESPPRELGSNIALDGKGQPCLVSGQVTGPDGEPLAGALVDVWQANEDGFYDVQQPDIQPERNLRGLFTADDEGRFWFRSVVPRYYPIPADGPVGQLLAATGRHPYRPAHLHFIVAAPGYRPVTTHVFVDGSPYLDSDAVFGVKESLVRVVPEVDDPSRAAEAGLANPFRTLTFDVTLLREDQAPPAAQPAEVQPTVVRGTPS